MDKQLVKEYRTADDYHRYAWENAKRRKKLASFYNKYKRYFGRTVLDLGCGGGVLGGILEPTGRSYVGVDGNPDMIREARKTANERGSKQRFILGDFFRVRLPGQFDTLTLLGNTLGHISVSEMDELLRNRAANVHRRSTFLLDYRDLIAMFWQRTWTKVEVQRFVRRGVVHRTWLVDLDEGRIHVRSRPSRGGWVLNWAHAIWSPFIMEAIMRSHGWKLVSRSPVHPGSGGKLNEHVTEVYRLERK